MLENFVAWCKLLAVFVVSWTAICAALVPVMIMNTPEGASPRADWSIALIVIPIVGAIIISRRVSRRSFNRIKEKREAIERDHLIAVAAANDAERWRQRQLIHQQVDRHRPALQRNLRNAVKKNDYGITVQDNRDAAILEFLASVGFEDGALSVDDAIEEVLADIEGFAEGQRQEGFDPTLVPINGHEFEQWVAQSLEKFGWTSSVTSKGGDQGIDVIATKNGYRLGLQCKLYSQSVGNRAIQEALAGAKYYGLHGAAVLSNAAFTKSAVELAESADVLLISQYDLPELDRRIFHSRSNQLQEF